MNFYDDRILPHLIHLAMRQRTFSPYRRRLAAGAEGRVLEIGIGSGLNLPLYPRAVTEVLGLDPSPRLLQKTRAAKSSFSYPLELVAGSAEAIPLDAGSVKTVVTSWTLCSIANIAAALHEVRRVLRADGYLLFVEHGRSPDTGVAGWQDRLTPIWKRVTGGCHLNRPMERLIEEAGFRIEQLQVGYMTGPKPMTFMYEGVARPI